MSSSTLIYIDSLSTASTTFLFTSDSSSYIINLGVVALLLVTVLLFIKKTLK